VKIRDVPNLKWKRDSSPWRLLVSNGTYALVAFEMQIAGSRAIRLPFTATVMRAVAATFLATRERQPDAACC
jgi:hypothetical protein